MNNPDLITEYRIIDSSNFVKGRATDFTIRGRIFGNYDQDEIHEHILELLHNQGWVHETTFVNPPHYDSLKERWQRTNAKYLRD